METESASQKTIRIWFRNHGYVSVILAIRVTLVTGLSVDLIITLWYTFMVIFVMAPWLAFAGMVGEDVLYPWLKKKLFKKHD